jgi:hypothetical protein
VKHGEDKRLRFQWYQFEWDESFVHPWLVEAISIISDWNLACQPLKKPDLYEIFVSPLAWFSMADSHFVIGKSYTETQTHCSSNFWHYWRCFHGFTMFLINRILATTRIRSLSIFLYHLQTLNSCRLVSWSTTMWIEPCTWYRSKFSDHWRHSDEFLRSVQLTKLQKTNEIVFLTTFLSFVWCWLINSNFLTALLLVLPPTSLFTHFSYCGHSASIGTFTLGKGHFDRKVLLNGVDWGKCANREVRSSPGRPRSESQKVEDEIEGTGELHGQLRSG